MFTKTLPANTKKALEQLVLGAKNILGSHSFYLAGGTAVALSLGHRVSYDLDWFTKKKFDPQVLQLELKDQGLSLSEIEVSKGTLKFKLDNSPVSLFEYDYPLVGKLFTPSRKLSFKSASLLDIGLMKITSIADRGLRKDFIDLYFISKELGGLLVILSKFSEKYVDANKIHYLKGLTYFEDADKCPEPEMLKEYDWDEVKSYFINEIKDMKLGDI